MKSASSEVFTPSDDRTIQKGILRLDPDNLYLYKINSAMFV